MRNLRRNLKLALALCVAADLALIGWLLSPRAPSRAATTQQLALTRAHLAALRAEIASHRLLNRRVQTSQRQIHALLSEGFPQQADLSSTLLSELSRLAAVSGVQVSGAQFNPDPKAQLGLRRVAISLQVAGGYSGVVRFVNQMERSPLFFIINQVSVTGGASTGSQTDTVKLQVQLEAYVRTPART